MIKILLAIVAIVGLFWFAGWLGSHSPDNKPMATINEGGFKYYIQVINGCEYICHYNGVYGGITITHKGNCKNPIHYKQ